MKMRGKYVVGILVVGIMCTVAFKAGWIAGVASLLTWTSWEGEQ